MSRSGGRNSASRRSYVRRAGLRSVLRSCQSPSCSTTCGRPSGSCAMGWRRRCGAALGSGEGWGG
eukprot:992035-Prymnesium_polylepis.1